MPFNRIFYATQGVALKGQNTDGTSVFATWYYPRGLQSIGMTTNFTLEQVFQLGQIELYDNMENVPEVEVTMSKVIDGTMPLYCFCMGGSAGPTNTSGKELVTLANNRVNVRLGLYSDDLAAATGTPTNYVDCSGMYLSSVSYTIPVEGNATEDVTLVGNNKVWNSGLHGGPSSNGIFGGGTSAGTMTATSIARRYKYSKELSTIPTGLGGGIPAPGGGTPRLQNVTISANLGREAIYELGSMAPYFRYVTFPLEVTSEFQIIASSGDMVDALDFSAQTSSCATIYKNLQDKTINIVVCGSGSAGAVNANTLGISLGDKNKLTSVNYTGGDTGGGNATITYSYQTFNKLIVNASGTFNETKWIDNTADADVPGGD
jgi:hypothetical protein